MESKETIKKSRPQITMDQISNFTVDPHAEEEMFNKLKNCCIEDYNDFEYVMLLNGCIPSKELWE